MEGLIFGHHLWFGYQKKQQRWSCTTMYNCTRIPSYIFYYYKNTPLSFNLIKKKNDAYV